MDPTITTRLPDVSRVGRIPMLAFKVVIGFLLALSLVFTAIRTAIRVRQHRRVYLDDMILLFACVTLVASTVLLYVINGTIYWQEQIVLYPSTEALSTMSTSDFYSRIFLYQKFLFSIVALIWTTIFAVKICFLLFFRQMVQRLPRLILYWKIVVGITIFCYCICVSGTFIPCPHLGHAALQCSRGSGFPKSLAVVTTETSLDLTTDVLVISIPVVLLWKIKISLTHKFALATFLCLSVCMMIVAIVRVSGMSIAGTNEDIQWEIFWQEVEANVSVIMVSITAFRSLLGMRAMQGQKKRERAWYSYHKRMLHWKTKKTIAQNLDLPSIPGGTMTGLRTYIRGSRGPSILLSNTCKNGGKFKNPEGSEPRDTVDSLRGSCAG